jgi:hypothetical protein
VPLQEGITRFGAPDIRPSQASAHGMRITEITERLDMLKEHGFITGWQRHGRASGRRWVIDGAAVYGPYTHFQVSAWLEGVQAMGAGSLSKGTH